MANISVGRKLGFVIRDGRPRRETVWFTFPFASASISASATAALMYSLNAAALDLLPFTIVRSRFRWLCVSDQSAATEAFIGNFGFAVVSDQAVAVGVTAVPTPASDLGSDLWFLIDQWIGRFDFVGTGTARQSLNQLTLDSKAMPKFPMKASVAAD